MRAHLEINDEAHCESPSVSDDVTVDLVEAAGCDSFPASDPPTWSSLRIGSPAQPTAPSRVAGPTDPFFKAHHTAT